MVAKGAPNFFAHQIFRFVLFLYYAEQTTQLGEGGKEGYMLNYSDRNSLMRMIEVAVLNDDRVSALRLMANRDGSDIGDALAAYLLQAIEGKKHPQSEPKWSALPPESQRFLLDCCGHVSLSCLGKSAVARAAALDANTLLSLSAEELKRRSRIGCWPVEKKGLLFGQYHSFLCHRASFPHLDLERVHLLGVYVWSRYSVELKQLGRNFDESALYAVASKALDYFRGTERTAGVVSGNADIVIRALCEAIKVGAVIVDGSKRDFIEAVGHWGVGALRNGDVRAWVAEELLDVHQLSEAELQSNATYWAGAARELGRRGVPLLIPDRQKREAFANGVRDVVGPCIVTDNAQIDRENFLGSQDPVERYILYWRHTDKFAYASYDPFGKPVHIFCTEEPHVEPTPSYEDYAAYVTKHQDFFQPK
jgi:hypothetical protein